MTLGVEIDVVELKRRCIVEGEPLARIIHEPPSKLRDVLCEKELRLSCLKHRANSNPH